MQHCTLRKYDVSYNPKQYSKIADSAIVLAFNSDSISKLFSGEYIQCLIHTDNAEQCNSLQCREIERIRNALPNYDVIQPSVLQ